MNTAFNAAASRQEQMAFFNAADLGDVVQLAAVLAKHPGAAMWHRPVDAGAIPFSRNETALMAAAAKNHVPAMRLLLENEAKVNAQTTRGWTALHIAAWEGHDAAADLLLSFGASTALRTDSDYTAAANAQLRGHGALAKTIMTSFEKYGLKFMNGGLPLSVEAPAKAAWKKRAPSKP